MLAALKRKLYTTFHLEYTKYYFLDKETTESRFMVCFVEKNFSAKKKKKKCSSFKNRLKYIQLIF